MVGRELYYYYHYMQNFALYSLQSLVVAYQNLSYLTEADWKVCQSIEMGRIVASATKTACF